jgi:ABC-type phosphate/phosphonate transport system substrate-binding protein
MDSKKRSVGASERDEFLRAAWRVMVAGEIRTERLVFVDECSTNTSLAPLYAWSPKGERALCYGATQLGGEHNAGGEHEHGRDGEMLGG